MQKLFISFALAAGFAVSVGLYAQPAQEQQVPNELVQYIRDARKAGVKDQQIQQNAINAGWPAEAVSMALKASPPNGTAGSKSEPAAKSIQRAPDTAAPPATSAKPTESTPAAASAGTTPVKAAEAPETAKTSPVVDRGVPDDYVIGAGDELQISVWKEPDASVPGVVVRPDGKISMPMLKEVTVNGLTPIQAEKVITEGLVKFIAAADVTVIVKAINSKKIYVVGGVKQEGPIPYTYRMTILQALSEAGGLTDYAKKKKIYVLRHENGRDYRYPFDYDAALRGEKMDLNIPLMPGDTLVIPK